MAEAVELNSRQQVAGGKNALRYIAAFGALFWIPWKLLAKLIDNQFVAFKEPSHQGLAKRDSLGRRLTERVL